MSDLIDPRAFSDDPETLQQYYKEHVLGTVASSWSFLREASAANVFQATAAFGRVIDIWNRKNDEGKDSAGTLLFLIQFNYSVSLSGPALSAVLTPAFALEAFLRLSAEIALYDLVEGAPALRLALNGFDAHAFESRFAAMTDLIGIPPLSSELRRDVQALVTFRNSVAHDTPMVYGPEGLLLQFKRGQTKLVQTPTDGAAFPRLPESRFPLRIGDGLRAVNIHDSIVAHVAVHASPEFQEAFQSRCHERLVGIQDLGGPNWAAASEVDRAWEEVLKWSSGISKEETESAYRSIVRQLTMKKVE